MRFSSSLLTAVHRAAHVGRPDNGFVPTSRPAEASRCAYGSYVINEPCIGTKDTSCVAVCPVDCIHPTPDESDFDAHEQLYIDPEECIDCDACVEACPVDAITSEDQVPPEWEPYIEINAAYYRQVRQ